MANYTFSGTHDAICAVSLISPFLNFKTTSCVTTKHYQCKLFRSDMEKRLENVNSTVFLYIPRTIKVRTHYVAEHIMNKLAVLNKNKGEHGIWQTWWLFPSTCLKKSNRLCRFFYFQSIQNNLSLDKLSWWCNNTFVTETVVDCNTLTPKYCILKCKNVYTLVC